MSTAQEHGDIPNTAVQFAPGLWRTSLQRYDLCVPGREMTQSRVDVEPVYNAGTALATDVAERGKPLRTVAQQAPGRRRAP
jgi:hypothetical protein